MSRPTETLADYVLGTLSRDETQALETHLETCAACRHEVSRLRETFYALPDALPLQAPPEDAWRKLQARRLSPRRPAYGSLRRWATAAVFSLLLVGSFVWGVAQQQKFRRVEAEQRVLTAWMNNPELTILPLSPGTASFPGILCTYPDGRALLVQKEEPPRGHVYRVWGVAGPDRTALGTTTSRILRFRSEGFDALEVSLEPRQGGESRPTRVIGRVSL